ncbi:DNAse I-like superfamily protein [Actinidia rufa]|uniref:DNAse I-like superfamily protein n=1 Tax=Actinidia rufa TaxID=165716 RepID=A0A7J0DJT0_9ERIC|nr:DNAse I-like superfamily protein [Actinidia rufa]
MEKPKKTGKQEKQKMPIAIGGSGGGGVGGVIVWGGVVAIATFVSVFAIKFRKKRSPNKCHPPSPVPSTDVSNKLELNNQNDDEGKGLRVILQDSSPPTDHHLSRNGITEMSPAQIDSTSLDMDDKPVLDHSGGNDKPTYLDVLLRNNLQPKSKDLVIDYGEMEIGELMREDKKIKAEEPVKEGGRGGGYGIEEDIGERVEVIGKTQFDRLVVEVEMEEIEVMKDEAAIVVPDASEIEEDKSPQMELIEEEKETNDGGDSTEKEDKEVEAIEDDPQMVLSEEEDNPQVQLIEEEGEFDDGGNIREKEVEVDSVQVTEEEDEDNPQVQLIEEREEEEIETVEDNPQAILSEDEDDDDDDEDEGGITERGEESSEGTGDSSIESNAEAIWPAESIEELSEEIKEFTINAQKQEKIYEYRTDATEENGDVYANGHHNNEDTGKSVTSSSKFRTIKEFLMGINKSTANLGIWIWSALVVVVLLLVVAPLLLSPANIMKLCLIIFLVAILCHWP